MSEEENTIKAKLIYNNNKLVADKIRKTLLNIRNVPGISAKRWIWELIQNAKDVPNVFIRVDIKIEIKKESLTFSHNGAFFTIDDILGILQQVSSKDSNNEGEQTGKFGTGFIGTHLLSGKVNIKGVVYYNNAYKRFKIYLDRTAESSEALQKEVHNSILKFTNNMEHNSNSEYEYMKVYNQEQEEDPFDTKFEYLFENANSLKIAQEGLDDLINTAPVTLCTQHKKISSIKIIDNIKNQITTYSHKYEKLEEENGAEIGLNTIEIKVEKNKKKTTKEEKYFYSYKTEKCRLLYQVKKKKDDSFEVVERVKGQPILYRDFPLIGSEKFHFPFFLDGFKFNPLETRNGLFLNGELNKEAKENREIIEEAIKSSINFTNWLLGQNINKRYFLAKTQIPEPPQNYDKIAIEWFIEAQKKWRKELINMKLVRSKKGNYNKLSLLKMPIIQGKFNENFFDLLSELNITGGILPDKNEAKLWYDILETDPLKEVYKITENTWGFDYTFTEIDLVKKINDFGSIQEMANNMSTDIQTIVDWLNKLYDFLNKNNVMNFLYQYNLVPNKNGKFKKINEIYGNEEANSIPEIINPIYGKVLEKEINDIMIHQRIKVAIFGTNLIKKSFKDVLNDFSNIFKQGGNNEKKQQLMNDLLSFAVKIPKINTMYNLRKETDDKYKDTPLEKLTDYHTYHSVWREVEDFWFDYHPCLIESQKNLKQLRILLKYEDNPEGEKRCLKWLNEYIIFLKENSTIIEKKKIFPNQLGNFEYITQLQYDESIPEILKNLHNNLESYEDKSFDIRKQLLHPDITSYKGYNKFTQKEIIGIINKKFKESKNNNMKNDISEKIICLLPINKEEKFKIISKALFEFIPYYNLIFDKKITPEKTEIVTELNYDFFLRYVLTRTLQEIQSMSKEKLLSKIDIIPHIIKFAWDYQDNEYLNLAVNPEKYKVFVNRNNEFEEISGLRFNENFKDVIKDEDLEKILVIAKSPPVNLDFKKMLLSTSFTTVLKNYKNKFNPLELSEICKNSIDQKLLEYYENINNSYSNRNLLDKEHYSFRNAFFALHDILKTSNHLKNYFPRYMRNRGTIALKFLEADDDMDSFIDDITRVVIFKTSE